MAGLQPNTATFGSVYQTPEALDALAIERRRQMAQALIDQSRDPLQGQMAGRMYVAPSWTQYAAKALQGWAGQRGLAKADEEQRAAAQSAMDRRQRLLQALMGGQGAAADPTAGEVTQEPGTGAANLPGLPYGPSAQGAPQASSGGAVGPGGMDQRTAMALMLSGDPALAGIGQQVFSAAIDPRTKLDVAKYEETGRHNRATEENAARNADLMGAYRQAMLQSQYLGNQIAAANLARNNAEFQYNTGMMPGGQMPAPGAPQPLPPAGGAPAGSPVAPPSPAMPAAPPPAGAQPAPGAIPPMAAIPPGVPPKLANDMRLKQFEAELSAQGAARKAAVGATAKRDANLMGIGDVIDQARAALAPESGPRPTHSGLGAAVDYGASLVGLTPPGAAQADKLKAISGALVAKMPRMEGPQSDFDVQNYKEMAGRVGDQTLPIARRLAALDAVEALWRKYDKTSPAGGVVVPTGTEIPSGAAGGLTPDEQAELAALRKQFGR